MTISLFVKLNGGPADGCYIPEGVASWIDGVCRLVEQHPDYDKGSPHRVSLYRRGVDQQANFIGWAEDN